MLVSYIYVNVYIKWFWLHQYTPWVVLIILMYISHNIMLYIALLKIRIVSKSIRIFHMIPVMQTHAYFVTRIMLAQRGSVRWRHLGLECVCAPARESGIALIKHIPSSGRRLVPKGGVSFPAPDSSLRHTRWQSDEGRCPDSCWAVNCHSVQLIFNTFVVLVIMIYYIVVMC